MMCVSFTLDFTLTSSITLQTSQPLVSADFALKFHLSSEAAHLATIVISEFEYNLYYYPRAF